MLREKKLRAELRLTLELLPDLLIMPVTLTPSKTSNQRSTALQPYLLNVSRCETRDSIGPFLHPNSVDISQYISACGTGYYSLYPDATSCECKICPAGTYNDREAATDCFQCPLGTTTVRAGATEQSQCQDSKKLN